MIFLWKILKNIPDLILNFLFLPIWNFCGFTRRNQNLWIFTSWFGKKYNDSSRIFFEYLNKNYPQINLIWISKDKSIVKVLKKKGFKACSAYSLKAIYYSATAGKIFSTTGYEMFYGFTNGAEIYELWHGMPLKKILNDDDFSGGNIRKNKLSHILYKINRKFFVWKTITTLPNLYTVSASKFFTPFLKSAFGLEEKHILPLGLPRIDALFYGKKEHLINTIRSRFPNCRIVLYMPTFRTGAWTKRPFEPFCEKYEFNESRFMNFLNQQNVVFLYKPHFYDLNLMTNSNHKNRFIMINDDDYEELYNFVGQVDILITDYSSIYFDFIVTRKPVILAPFDLDEYLATCRSHYFDYEELEGERAWNWKDVESIISNKNYKTISNEKLKQFAEFNDGNSCERLFKYLCGDKNEKADC